MKLFDRIHVLRFLYYVAVGCFQIRNPEHHLKVLFKLKKKKELIEEIKMVLFSNRYMIEKL